MMKVINGASVIIDENRGGLGDKMRDVRALEMLKCVNYNKIRNKYNQNRENITHLQKRNNIIFKILL